MRNTRSYKEYICIIVTFDECIYPAAFMHDINKFQANVHGIIDGVGQERVMMIWHQVALVEMDFEQIRI